jgi:hypothetical protein
MNMNLDYTKLFSSLGSGAADAAGSSILSDWNSLKNGSTYKLYKAHYAEEANKVSETNDKSKTTTEKADTDSTDTAGKATTSTSDDNAKTLAAIQSSADNLKESARALMDPSLYEDSEVTATDKDGNTTATVSTALDKIFSALETFVKDYNSLMESGDDAKSSSMTRTLDRLIGGTNASQNLLSRIGITIGEDNTLSLDKDTYNKANKSTVQTLFTGTGSFGDQTASRASTIKLSADREAAKAVTYKETGNFADANTAGSVFNSYL